jgi:Fur family transcriptional regulator, zinc uptake regulator
VKPLGLNSNDQVVLNELGGSGRALSAYEILDRARSEALKAPVQVYRSLQKLQQRGLVHRIEALNAFVACSGHRGSCRLDGHQRSVHRPGFVICEKCGSVREFQDPRVAELATQLAGADFAIRLVSLEVFGLCAQCQGH